MSRTHLYRASARAKPIASLVLGGAWFGAGVTVLIAMLPTLLGGVPLHGPAAGFQDRVHLVLAAGALLVGIGIVASELSAGRTFRRGTRLLGAALLLLAGGAGTLDTARRLVRPGTPTGSVAGPSIAEAAEPTLSPADAALVSVARQRVVWTVIGLLGASAVLGGALTALRRSGPGS